MADLEICSSTTSSLLVKTLTKRRFWVSLFLIVYLLLLSSSWNLLLSIRSHYNAAVATADSILTLARSALFASLLYGLVFGLFSMAAALAVAVPATVMTWITILVLLAFAGKPRTALVTEGRKVTRDIASLAFRILIREGNLVAVVCAGASFVLMVVRRRGGQQDDDDKDL